MGCAAGKGLIDGEGATLETGAALAVALALEAAVGLEGGGFPPTGAGLNPVAGLGAGLEARRFVGFPAGALVEDFFLGFGISRATAGARPDRGRVALPWIC